VRDRDSLTAVEPERSSDVGHVEAVFHDRVRARRDELEARVKAIRTEVRARSCK